MKPFMRDHSTGKDLELIHLIDSENNALLGHVDVNRAVNGLKHGNLTLDADLYELTMTAGYYLAEKGNQRACFELYYRKNPDNGAFCIFAGLQSVIDYVNNLRIYPDDIDYLDSLGIFPKEALTKLAYGIKFTGDIWAVPEGTVVFPNEPLIRVIAPIAEAQILETTLLALVGHQTLIATKAARLCIAARGTEVVDFGARRAHGVGAALYGARAAYIGGCSATSNVRAGKMFGAPVRGTHAHSWIESFDTELEAFEVFANIYPNNCVLLVDTYDVKEGMRNAVIVAKSLEKKGSRLIGVRIDSGDLAYYSKTARRILDEAGLPYVKILASSDLDEWIIESLREQGSPIDVWCVGTRLITSYQTPALGVVYKLMAADQGDKILEPKIKISQNPEKVTNPGVKKLIRFYNGNGCMIGDLLADPEEPLPQSETVLAHHPMYDYMKKLYKFPYVAEELLEPVFKDGTQVYTSPPLDEIKARATLQIGLLEPEYKRFSNPHIYKVSLSDRVFKTKKRLMQFYQEKNHQIRK